MSIVRHVRLIIGLAWRHLVGHRRKNAITGAVLALNAAFVVFGAAVVSTMDARIFRLLSSTISGDLQVYSADAPEEMLLTAAQNGARPPDLGTIDFPKVLALLHENPNITDVVAQGTFLANCILPNIIDARVEALRIAVRENGAGGPAVDAAAARARGALDAEASELERLQKVPGVEPPSAAELAALTTARSDEFWRDFKTAPGTAIRFLEDKIVPLAGDTDAIGFPVIGVDMQAFRKGFSAYKLVKGDWVAPGQRGVILNRSMWDFYFEYSAARELDRLYKDLVVDKKPLSAEAVRDRAKVIADGYEDILLQLDQKLADQFEGELRKLLKKSDGNLVDLLKDFLTVDASTIAERYDFYKTFIVPKVRLHRIEPGDSLLLRAFGTFPTSVEVKFCGVVEVPEFKDAPVANLHHFVDMISFRILEGEVTNEMQDEFTSLQKAVPFVDVTYEDIEKGLTAQSMNVTTDVMPKPEQDDFEIKGGSPLSQSYTQEQVEHGRVAHAAVFVKNLDDLGKTERWIKRESKQRGIPLQIGGLKQFAITAYQLEFFRAVIIGGTLVVLLVVVLVSLLGVSIVVLGRLREMGVLRALGAAPAVATQALMLEMMMLGGMAGVLGTSLGALIVHFAGTYGIPAPTPSLRLIFAGSRLFPHAAPSIFVVGVVSTIVVAFIATLYPARVASRVLPAIAIR